MATMNRVLLVGNLTRHPELRYTPSGTPVTTLRLGANRRYTANNGESREERLFMDVVAWGAQAEAATRYLTKGSAVLVDGHLRTREWTDAEGHKHALVEAVAERLWFLPRKAAASAAAQDPSRGDLLAAAEDGA
jgi:single-strand DNA-binding protein